MYLKLLENHEKWFSSMLEVRRTFYMSKVAIAVSVHILEVKAEHQRNRCFCFPSKKKQPGQKDGGLCSVSFLIRQPEWHNLLAMGLLWFTTQ